jgi:hypothetical protein
MTSLFSNDESVGQQEIMHNICSCLGFTKPGTVVKTGFRFWKVQKPVFGFGFGIDN